MTQVLTPPHSSHKSILQYSGNIELLIQNLENSKKTNKRRETAYLSISPSFLCTMTARTVPDPGHLPTNYLEFSGKGRALLTEVLLNIFPTVHPPSKDSQIEQDCLSKANASTWASPPISRFLPKHKQVTMNCQHLTS